MTKLVLDKVNSGASLSVINDNFQKIEDELQNKVMYRSNPLGEPNSFSSDVDMNSKRIYNLPTPTLPSEAARLQDVTNAVSGAKSANLVTFSPYGNISSTNVQAAVQEVVDDLGGSSGAGLIGWTQSGTGTSTRTLQAKEREIVSILDFSGSDPTGDSDSLSAFTSAIARLPELGGAIKVPSGVWNLSAVPTWGTKSIFWDIDPSATFTGAGTGQNKFPSMRTNGGQIAVGPYIQSQSRIPYTYSTPFAGGVAAFQVEMIQPIDVLGQSVALYLGAEGSNPASNANVWAGNFLVKAAAGAGGTYQGIEVDVDSFSPSALVKGISVNGIGTVNVYCGIEIIRSDATKYSMGINVRNSLIGIQIENDGINQGIVIGAPTLVGKTAIEARQLANGMDTLILQRSTNTAPTGQFIRCLNSDNSAVMATLDISGNMSIAGGFTASGSITGNVVSGTNLRATVGAAVPAAGVLGIGNSTATSATAGAASALPALPLGYINGYLGTTQIKIPYYNA